MVDPKALQRQKEQQKIFLETAQAMTEDKTMTLDEVEKMLASISDGSPRRPPSPPANAPPPQKVEVVPTSEKKMWMAPPWAEARQETVEPPAGKAFVGRTEVTTDK